MFVAALLAGRHFASALCARPTHRGERAGDRVRPGRLRRRSTVPCWYPTIRNRTLDAFVQSLGTSEAIRFRRAGAAEPAHPPVEVRTPLGRVPHWFVDLLGLPEIGATFPVTIEGKQVGDIVFSPDISADIYEKWIGFLAIVSSGIVLMLLTGTIAYFTADTVIEAAAESGRRADADADRATMGGRLPRRGRRRSAGVPRRPTNLPARCSRLSHDNRSLLRKIVSLQDDERRDMARELHDELGPLLFGIRANAVALLDGVPQHRKSSSPPFDPCSNRSRRCSRPTAVSSTGCGRFTSRNSGWRRASRPCCKMPAHGAEPQTDIAHRSPADRRRRPAFPNRSIASSRKP